MRRLDVDAIFFDIEPFSSVLTARAHQGVDSMLVDHADLKVSIGWCNGNGQPSVGHQMNRSHNYTSSDNNEFPALMHINSEHCATALPGKLGTGAADMDVRSIGT
jgi:hypothetical protein